jgi:hypothetical protein
MKVLAVIPARMGSTRMPWKNRLEIEPGVSLAQHAVECARGSGICDHVVVSTDAPEDLPIRNAFVSRRPHDLSSASADIADVVRYELEVAERMMSIRFDLVVTLQPAVLARSPLIVRRLIEEVGRRGARGGLTMCPVHPWLWEAAADYLGAWWLPGVYPRSQDCSRRWQEINAVQVAAADAVRSGSRWDWPLVVMDLPTWAASLDVDTPNDLDEARDLWPFARRKLETWMGSMHLFAGPDCRG